MTACARGLSSRTLLKRSTRTSRKKYCATNKDDWAPPMRSGRTRSSVCPPGSRAAGRYHRRVRVFFVRLPILGAVPCGDDEKDSRRHREAGEERPAPQQSEAPEDGKCRDRHRRGRRPPGMVQDEEPKP